jgi:arabinose-5-phosphate isomerase
LKVSVQEVMVAGEKIPLVEKTVGVAEAISELNVKNLGAVLIVDTDMILLGIITDGDVRRIALGTQSLNDLDLDSVMTVDPVTIGPDLLAADALSIMQRHEITVLPVVDDQHQLKGLLHLHELLGKGEFRFLI